jgi:hypothetical protein
MWEPRRGTSKRRAFDALSVRFVDLLNDQHGFVLGRGVQLRRRFGRMSKLNENEVPSVRTLEAAEERERNDARELLAAFDRPARGPKNVAPERDFVEYFSLQKNKTVAPSPRPISPSRRAMPTVVRSRSRRVCRSRRVLRALLVLVAGLLMLALGALVAYVATGKAPEMPKIPARSHQ